MKTVGFVPTMGALHEGHLSLVRTAREQNDEVVVSIFVNPLQFGPSEDFERYPRDMQGDSQKAIEAGATRLLTPTVDEMYPIETRIDPGPIGDVLEGQFRPGFFVGVATVCVKLFNLVQPHRAYFGEKDAQQLAVIRQVAKDLNLPIEIIRGPTIRETDGLAMSSRNAYLQPEQRRAAVVLSKALFEARDSGEYSADALKKIVTERVAEEPAVELQYVEAVDPLTFQSVSEITGRSDGAVLALAAFVGETRLIDNVEVTCK